MNLIPETYSIYVLVDPTDGEIHYVGMTAFRKMRYSGHISSGRCSARLPKDRWIGELLKQGLRPKMFVLSEYEDPCEASFWEQKWIQRLALAGCDLLNVMGLQYIELDRQTITHLEPHWPATTYTPPQPIFTYWPPVKIPGLPQWLMLDKRVVRRCE